MGELDLLLKAFESHVSTPWRDGLSGSERVWFLVYSPTNERRLRRRIDEFAIATRDAGYGWKQLDITDLFPQWITSQRHADGYFRRPQGLPEKRFVESAAEGIRSILATASQREVIAMTGAGALFGLTPLSAILKLVEDAVMGRLLVCFPGTYEADHHRYRLLGAGEGWSYLAVPILAQREVIQ